MTSSIPYSTGTVPVLYMYCFVIVLEDSQFDDATSPAKA